MRKFARRGDLPQGLGLLSDRELAVFSLIAAGNGPSQIAKELGISRKTVECHCEHIKLKLGYPDAGALRRGARELSGASEWSPTSPRRVSEDFEVQKICALK
jgi:DNA-binding CsgD family transcriptional regulator